jgi:hypothetical protein
VGAVVNEALGVGVPVYASVHCGAQVVLEGERERPFLWIRLMTSLSYCAAGLKPVDLQQKLVIAFSLGRHKFREKLPPSIWHIFSVTWILSNVALLNLARQRPGSVSR